MNLQKKMIYLQKDNLIQCYKKIKDSLDTNHTSKKKENFPYNESVQYSI